MILATVILLGIALQAEPSAPAVPASPELPPVLTLPDALRIARERAPDRVAANAAVDVARAQVRVAGALPNPAASFMVGWSSQCTDPGCNHPVFNAGLGDQGAVATLVTGQHGLAVDVAEHGLEASEASRQDLTRNLDFQVKQQFVATAVAARAVEVAREAAGLAGETVVLARRRFAAGAISDADLARLEVLQMQFEQAADRLEQSHEQARSALGQLLGLRSGPPVMRVEAGATATALPPSPLAGATLESLVASGLEHRPDLAAARSLLAQARSQAALARRMVIPQFQLQAQYQQQGATGGWFTPPTASVGLTVPLPVLYQQQGQIGQADAGVIVAEAGVAKVEAQVVAEVSAAFGAYRTSRSAAERAERRLLPRSRDARDLVQVQYAKGAASLLDYLDAQRTHLSNEIDRLSALGSFWTAVFQLEQAVGASYLP